MATRRYGRHTVHTSNEDKVLFPDSGITKAELVDYYEQIAGRVLPYLRDRALVLQRFPDGIERSGFYQKRVGRHFPDWLTTVRVEVATPAGNHEMAVCDTTASLAFLADQACVSLHPWLSRRDRVRHPDLLVIDLDPPPGEFERARRASLLVRDLLDELGLPAYAKITGSEGVHVIVPLDRRSSFDTVRAFARQAMRLLAERYPSELTTEQRRRRRRGRLYLDTGRNAYGQTAVAPWCVRPRAGAPVATPVSWADLESGDVGPDDCTLRQVRDCIARRGDPWAGFRRRARSLAAARERLGDIARAG